jgi:hypothetical protein
MSLLFFYKSNKEQKHFLINVLLSIFIFTFHKFKEIDASFISVGLCEALMLKSAG